MRRAALPITNITWLRMSLVLRWREHTWGCQVRKEIFGLMLWQVIFIPGTGSPVPEANERTQVSYSAVFVGSQVINTNIMHGSPRTQKLEQLWGSCINELLDTVEVGGGRHQVCVLSIEQGGWFNVNELFSMLNFLSRTFLLFSCFF